MYQILRKLMPQTSTRSEQELSVHFLLILKSQKSLVNKDIQSAVAAVQTVNGMRRLLRKGTVVPMKYPLLEFVIIHKDTSILKDLQSVKDFARGGFNVLKVTFCQHRELYSVQMHAERNFLTLGKKGGRKIEEITDKIRDTKDGDIEKLLSKGASERLLTVIDDVLIESEDVHIVGRVLLQSLFPVFFK